MKIFNTFSESYFNICMPSIQDRKWSFNGFIFENDILYRLLDLNTTEQTFNTLYGHI